MLTSIQLTCGRKVFVNDFECSETYGGLLEGWPTVEINKSIIDASVLKARHLWSKAASPVYMIEPVCTPNPNGELKTFIEWTKRILRSGGQPGPILPPVTCVAHLQSAPIDNQSSWTRQVVVWFQEPFFERPLKDVLQKSLENIPWETSAKRFDF